MGGYLHMGGYAAFVWPSFLVTAVVMIGLLVVTVGKFRRTEATLEALEERKDNAAEKAE